MHSRSIGRHRRPRNGLTAPRVLIPVALATGIGTSGQAWAAETKNPPPVPSPAKMLQVFQKNLNFHPTELVLKPGDSVTWTNKEEDDTTHSVVQGNGSEIDS